MAHVTRCDKKVSCCWFDLCEWCVLALGKYSGMGVHANPLKEKNLRYQGHGPIHDPYPPIPRYLALYDPYPWSIVTSSHFYSGSCILVHLDAVSECIHAAIWYGGTDCLQYKKVYGCNIPATFVDVDGFTSLHLLARWEYFLTRHWTGSTPEVLPCFFVPIFIINYIVPDNTSIFQWKAYLSSDCDPHPFNLVWVPIPFQRTSTFLA